MMKIFYLTLLCALLANPAFAKEKDKSAPTKASAIDSSGIWRSDSGLIEAEKLMKEQKYVDALTILDQVIARNMRNTDAHVDTAIVWINLGNLDKAKSSLSTAMMIDRNHLGIYVISGVVALLEQDAEQAANQLSALRILCKSETCPEFQTLQRMIRQTRIEKKESGFFF